MCGNGSARCPAAFTKPRCLIEEPNIITRSFVHVCRGCGFSVNAFCKNESRPRKVLERARGDGEIKVSLKAEVYFRNK